MALSNPGCFDENKIQKIEGREEEGPFEGMFIRQNMHRNIADCTFLYRSNEDVIKQREEILYLNQTQEKTGKRYLTEDQITELNNRYSALNYFTNLAYFSKTPNKHIRYENGGHKESSDDGTLSAIKSKRIINNVIQKTKERVIKAQEDYFKDKGLLSEED